MIRTISRAEKEGHDRAVRLGVVHYYVNSAVLYCMGPGMASLKVLTRLMASCWQFVTQTCYCFSRPAMQPCGDEVEPFFHSAPRHLPTHPLTRHLLYYAPWIFTGSDLRLSTQQRASVVRTRSCPSPPSAACPATAASRRSAPSSTLPSSSQRNRPALAEDPQVWEQPPS